MRLQASRQPNLLGQQRTPLSSNTAVAAALKSSTRRGGHTFYCMPPCLHPENLLPRCTRFSILKSCPHSPTNPASVRATTTGASTSLAVPEAGESPTGSVTTKKTRRFLSNWVPWDSLNDRETDRCAIRPQQHYATGYITSVSPEDFSASAATSVPSYTLRSFPAETVTVFKEDYVNPQGDMRGSGSSPPVHVLTLVRDRQPDEGEFGYSATSAAPLAASASVPAAVTACRAARTESPASLVEPVDDVAARTGAADTNATNLRRAQHIKTCTRQSTRAAPVCATACLGGSQLRLRPEDVRVLEQQHQTQQARRHQRGVDWWLAERQRHQRHPLDTAAHGSRVWQAQHFVDSEVQQYVRVRKEQQVSHLAQHEADLLQQRELVPKYRQQQLWWCRTGVSGQDPTVDFNSMDGRPDGWDDDVSFYQEAPQGSKCVVTPSLDNCGSDSIGSIRSEEHFAQSKAARDVSTAAPRESTADTAEATWGQRLRQQEARMREPQESTGQKEEATRQAHGQRRREAVSAGMAQVQQEADEPAKGETGNQALRQRCTASVSASQGFAPILRNANSAALSLRSSHCSSSSEHLNCSSTYVKGEYDREALSRKQPRSRRAYRRNRSKCSSAGGGQLDGSHLMSARVLNLTAQHQQSIERQERWQPHHRLTQPRYLTSGEYGKGNVSDDAGDVPPGKLKPDCTASGAEAAGITYSRRAAPAVSLKQAVKRQEAANAHTPEAYLLRSQQLKRLKQHESCQQEHRWRETTEKQHQETSLLGKQTDRLDLQLPRRLHIRNSLIGYCGRSDGRVSGRKKSVDARTRTAAELSWKDAQGQCLTSLGEPQTGADPPAHTREARTTGTTVLTTAEKAVVDDTVVTEDAAPAQDTAAGEGRGAAPPVETTGAPRAPGRRRLPGSTDIAPEELAAGADAAVVAPEEEQVFLGHAKRRDHNRQVISGAMEGEDYHRKFMGPSTRLRCGLSKRFSAKDLQLRIQCLQQLHALLDKEERRTHAAVAPFACLQAKVETHALGVLAAAVTVLAAAQEFSLAEAVQSVRRKQTKNIVCGGKRGCSLSRKTLIPRGNHSDTELPEDSCNEMQHRWGHCCRTGETTGVRKARRRLQQLRSKCPTTQQALAALEKEIFLFEWCALSGTVNRITAFKRQACAQCLELLSMATQDSDVLMYGSDFGPVLLGRGRRLETTSAHPAGAGDLCLASEQWSTAVATTAQRTAAALRAASFPAFRTATGVPVSAPLVAAASANEVSAYYWPVAMQLRTGRTFCAASSPSRPAPHHQLPQVRSELSAYIGPVTYSSHWCISKVSSTSRQLASCNSLSGSSTAHVHSNGAEKERYYRQPYQLTAGGRCHSAGLDHIFRLRALHVSVVEAEAALQPPLDVKTFLLSPLFIRNATATRLLPQEDTLLQRKYPQKLRRARLVPVVQLYLAWRSGVLHVANGGLTVETRKSERQRPRSDGHVRRDGKAVSRREPPEKANESQSGQTTQPTNSKDAATWHGCSSGEYSKTKSRYSNRERKEDSASGNVKMTPTCRILAKGLPARKRSAKAEYSHSPASTGSTESLHKYGCTGRTSRRLRSRSTARRCGSRRSSTGTTACGCRWGDSSDGTDARVCSPHATRAAELAEAQAEGLAWALRGGKVSKAYRPTCKGGCLAHFSAQLRAFERSAIRLEQQEEARRSTLWPDSPPASCAVVQAAARGSSGGLQRTEEGSKAARSPYENASKGTGVTTINRLNVARVAETRGRFATEANGGRGEKSPGPGGEYGHASPDEDSQEQEQKTPEKLLAAAATRAAKVRRLLAQAVAQHDQLLYVATLCHQAVVQAECGRHRHQDQPQRLPDANECSSEYTPSRALIFLPSPHQTDARSSEIRPPKTQQWPQHHSRQPDKKQLQCGAGRPCREAEHHEDRNSLSEQHLRAQHTPQQDGNMHQQVDCRHAKHRLHHGLSCFEEAEIQQEGYDAWSTEKRIVKEFGSKCRRGLRMKACDRCIRSNSIKTCCGRKVSDSRESTGRHSNWRRHSSSGPSWGSMAHNSETHRRWSCCPSSRRVAAASDDCRRSTSRDSHRQHTKVKRSSRMRMRNDGSKLRASLTSSGRFRNLVRSGRIRLFSDRSNHGREGTHWNNLSMKALHTAQEHDSVQRTRQEHRRRRTETTTHSPDTPAPAGRLEHFSKANVSTAKLSTAATPCKRAASRAGDLLAASSPGAASVTGSSRGYSISSALSRPQSSRCSGTGFVSESNVTPKHASSFLSPSSPVPFAVAEVSASCSTAVCSLGATNASSPLSASTSRAARFASGSLPPVSTASCLAGFSPSASGRQTYSVNCFVSPAGHRRISCQPASSDMRSTRRLHEARPAACPGSAETRPAGGPDRFSLHSASRVRAVRSSVVIKKPAIPSWQLQCAASFQYCAVGTAAQCIQQRPAGVSCRLRAVPIAVSLSATRRRTQQKRAQHRHSYEIESSSCTRINSSSRSVHSSSHCGRSSYSIIHSDSESTKLRSGPMARTAASFQPIKSATSRSADSVVSSEGGVPSIPHGTREQPRSGSRRPWKLASSSRCTAENRESKVSKSFILPPANEGLHNTDDNQEAFVCEGSGRLHEDRDTSCNAGGTLTLTSKYRGRDSHNSRRQSTTWNEEVLPEATTSVPVKRSSHTFAGNGQPWVPVHHRGPESSAAVLDGLVSTEVQLTRDAAASTTLTAAAPTVVGAAETAPVLAPQFPEDLHC